MRHWLSAMAVVCLAACGDDAASSPDGGASAGTGGDGDGDGDTYENGELGEVDPGTGSECLVSDTSLELARGPSALDLVFAIKNSNSMRDEQLDLASELPRLLRALTRGDADDDGTEDFAPATDVHIGIVSTDLGLVGIDGIPNCSGLGDDGALHNSASPDAEGCSAQTYAPRFLSFAAGDDVDQVGTDLACLAQIGADGCHFTQPLESLLKAVWPADDQQVWFLPDPSGFGSTGQGGPSGENGDIVRDGFDGSSLLGFVVITDDDDCSAGNSSHLRPDDGTLSADDPRKQQGLNTRCFFESMLDRDPTLEGMQNNLYAPFRYIQTLRALRADRPERVVFAAIAGVPADLVSAAALADVDFDSRAATDAFYDAIQSDERMVQRLMDNGTAEVADDMLMPSCEGEVGFEAHPPTRLVEVVRGFGKHGLLQSMCEPDLAPSIDALIRKLGEHLGEPCSPEHARDEDGAIGCDVIWELASASAASNSIASCEERPFLTRLEGVSARGGELCKVAQRVAREDGELPDEEGWYYDDFSPAAQSCRGEGSARIAFTEGAAPPPGIIAKLRCLHADTDDGEGSVLECLPGPEVASAEHVGDPCFTHVVPEGGFYDSMAYVEPVSESCGGAACIVYHLGGDPRDGCERPSSCEPSDSNDCPVDPGCAQPGDIEERVYCSCRCDGPAGLPTCACPDDYSCVPLIHTGPLNAQGSYCVRNRSSVP
jgi:hypothetical protein